MKDGKNCCIIKRTGGNEGDESYEYCDVGICSISNGICHLFGRSTAPFEQIHLVLCCSVLVSIILCYLPVNYFDLVLICCNGYAFLRCHVARQLSRITIKMQVHQKHTKTTSPNQTKTNCPPPTLRKKSRQKTSQHIFVSKCFVCRQFLVRRFFLVGQELESALVAQLQKDAVAFSVGVLTQNGMGWFGLKTML